MEISISRDKYFEPIRYKLGELEVELFIPQFMIPYSIESKYNTVDDSFVIKFLYGDSEEEKTICNDDNICLHVGKYSNKISSIVLKQVQKNKIGKLQLKAILEKDVNRMIDKHRGFLKVIIEQAIYDKYKRTLEESIDKLLDSSHQFTKSIV